MHIEFCSREFNEDLYFLLEHYNAGLYKPTYKPIVHETLTRFLKWLMGTNIGTYKTHVTLKFVI